MARKTKSGEPSLREKLSQKFLEALQEDFEVYGKSVLEDAGKPSRTIRRVGGKNDNAG
jgi:hypothetical protein